MLDPLAAVACLPEPKPILKVVALYEDFTSGKRVRATFNALARQFGQDCDFQLNLWRFDILRLRQVEEMIAQEANDADLIIVSARHLDLPAGFKTWLDSWRPAPAGRDRALVALLKFDEEEADCLSPAYTFLKNFACRANMKFLSQFVPPESHGVEYSLEQMAQRASRTSIVLEGILHRSDAAPRWGINE